MTITENGVNNKRFSLVEVTISLGLFLLALLPRAYDLQRFVTADEAKWVYRSAQFLAAFLQGDFPATSVNLTPAVSTTWLGSLGLTLYYCFNQPTLNLLFNDWLLSLPQFRTELPILVATRWPMVIFTSLGVVVFYLLTRQLFNRPLAILAAAFIALGPHNVALSRILGHDAPAALFMIVSLLLLLLALKQAEDQSDQSSQPTSLTLLFILSGLSAGLAFLSKAPTLFLIPFAGLIFLGQIWHDKKSFFYWLKLFLIWAIVAYLTFVTVWPAAWIDPLGRLWAVIENAFLSATDQTEVVSETFWRVPNLGPFYYIVNVGFKLSPLVLLGLGLLLIMTAFSKKQTLENDGSRKATPISQSPITWLLAFVILFTIFMTLGDKRSPRYILPIFPALAILAASGWLKLSPIINKKWHGRGNKHRNEYPIIKNPTPYAPGPISPYILPAILVLSAMLLLYPYTPYHFTYFNPLLGGSYIAPHVVKIGWGEGLGQVGRFLQREVAGSRVGTAYASTVAPFFKGDLSSVSGDNLDYLVLYSKQVQSGNPSPTFIRYFEQNYPLFSVELNGIPYAAVYPGPAIQTALPLESTQPQAIGFRPYTSYGHIGETLEVDLLWETDTPPKPTSATLSLGPLTALEPAEPTEHHPIWAEAQANLIQTDEALIISHHQLLIPKDLERGHYALLVDGQPLGKIELRLFQTPEWVATVSDTSYDNQIALTGYQLGPTEDFITVNLIWQALQSHLPDYTVFVQLLNEETNERVAGFDTQPVDGKWPTSRWVADEVVIDKHLIAVPYGLPPAYYKIIVGLYQPQTGQRLLLADGQDHWTIPWSLQRKE